MSLETLSIDDKQKLKEVVNQGIAVLQEVDDLKGGLKDTVKSIAEELNIKPAMLNKAIRTAFKSNIEEQNAQIEEVEEILLATGRL